MIKTDPVSYQTADTGSPFARAILEDTTLPGERILYVSAISAAIYWDAVAAFIVSAALTALFSPYIGAYFFVISALLAIVDYTTRKYLLLGATDERIICRAGIFYAETISMRYDAIESVEIITSLMGQMMGYSNVVVTGTGGRRFMVPYVADALEFRTATLLHMARRTLKAAA